MLTFLFKVYVILLIIIIKACIFNKLRFIIRCQNKKQLKNFIYKYIFSLIKYSLSVPELF